MAHRLAPSDPRLRLVAGRNLLLRRYQNDLTARLAQAGVRALPVKGVALAEALYPDLSWREVWDIDLLVTPAGAGKAYHALCDLGLRPNHAWNAAGLSRQIRRPAALAPELVFSGPQGLPVELHWNWPVGELPESGLFADPEAYLVYLCRHAAQHFWSRFKWCCDIELLIRRRGWELDWDRFWRLAESCGSARSCAVTLLLCRTWFAGDLPAGLESRLNRRVRRLANDAQSLICGAAGHAPHPVWRQIRLAGWPDRFRMAAAWLAPRPQDRSEASGLRVRWVLWRDRAAHLWRRWAPGRMADLSGRDWPILGEAYLAVALAELARRFLPASRLLAGARRRGPGAAVAVWPRERLRRLACLVDAAANRQPVRVRCLARSLALTWMLRRRGLHPALRIGFRRSQDGLEAHAWVECQGEVINGAAWENASAVVFTASPRP